MNWVFNDTRTIEDKNFNPILEKFYQFGVSGLVRENIQNSLDARLDKEKPVEVIIKIGNHDKSDIPYFNEIVKRIENLKGGNNYSKESIDVMVTQLKGEKFNYISFEDKNTTGLSGAEIGYSQSVKCNYHAYAYSKGDHYEDDDSESENIRGGSHGVGKIASNSASYFNMMFFANCDKNLYKTLGATVQLMDHSMAGKNYRSTGYYTNVNNQKDFTAFENINYPKIFEKETRGLKIIIPFLRENFNDNKEITRTVIDSFLIAIMNNILVVSINDKKINCDNVESYISDEDLFTENEYDFSTPLYFETIKANKSQLIEIEFDNRIIGFDIYFRYNQEIKFGRTGIFRTIGMKIEDRKLSGYSNKPYNAIILPKTSKGDALFKSLENESHTTIGYKHIKNEQNFKKAKKFIYQLNNKIKEIIDKEINDIYPNQGEVDTSDILFEFDNKFKHEYNKKYSQINIGGYEGKRKIVKVNSVKEDGDSAVKRVKINGEVDNSYKRVKKIFGEKSPKTYIQLPSSSVKRIRENKNEVILIKLPNFEKTTDKKKCNVLVSIVDGAGKEYYNEFDMTKMYKEPYDDNSKKNLTISESSIIGVTILKNEIKIILGVKSHETYYAKLRYYLEV